MKRLLSACIVLCGSLLFTKCAKQQEALQPSFVSHKPDYGDSVFYLKENAYTISPKEIRSGTYSAFPSNLQIDPKTGVIDVTLNGNDGNSQTGMWYKIKFTADGTGQSDSSYILLSGLNYVDQFYHLNRNDSIIYPIYNGDVNKTLPSGQYDIGHENGSDKLVINATNGQININESIRRGFFDTKGWKEVTLKYRINDQSKAVLNSMKIILYYYHTLDDVPNNVSAIMKEHQEMALNVRLATVPLTKAPNDYNLPSDFNDYLKGRAALKPRPPCIVIVGI